MFACCSRTHVKEKTPQELAADYKATMTTISTNIRAIGGIFNERVSRQDWAPVPFKTELDQIKGCIAEARAIQERAKAIQTKTTPLPPRSRYWGYMGEFVEQAAKTTSIAGLIYNQATADPNQRFQSSTGVYVAGGALIAAIGISELNKWVLRARASRLEVQNALEQVLGEGQDTLLATASSVASILEYRITISSMLKNPGDADSETAILELLAKLDAIPSHVGLNVTAIAQQTLGEHGIALATPAPGALARTPSERAESPHSHETSPLADDGSESRARFWTLVRDVLELRSVRGGDHVGSFGAAVFHRIRRGEVDASSSAASGSAEGAGAAYGGVGGVPADSSAASEAEPGTARVTINV